MKKKKLNLENLKVKSFVTEDMLLEKLKGGIYCPVTLWDDTVCYSDDPHNSACASTGNTDDPTGMFFSVIC